MAPQIAVYDAPERGIRPSETGIQAVAGAARRVQGAFNEAAEAQKEAGARIGNAVAAAGSAAVDYIDHMQISQGANAFSALRLAKTQEWQDIHSKADPNDPTVAEKFRDGLNADLDKFKSGFLTEKGQAWAEAHANQFREHMFQKTAADQSAAAGHAVKINQAATTNNLANSVYIDPSKSNLDDSLRTLDSSTTGVVGTSPTLNNKRQVKDALVNDGAAQIVKAAALGHIDKTGELPPWISDPKYAKYINVAELRQFEKAARAQTRTFELQQKQFDAYTKQQNIQAVNDAVDDNRNNNTAFDPNTNRYTIKPEFFENAHKIGNMPEGRHAGDSMMAWGQRQQDKRPPRVTSDPAVHNDLLDRLTTPTDNPTTEIEIRTAEARDQIAPRDATHMVELYRALNVAPIRDPNFNAAMQATKQFIGTDPSGQANYANFRQSFIPQYLDAKKANTLPPNALDLNDPKSMIRQSMDSYVRPYAQQLIDKAMHPLPNQPAAVPAAKPDIVQGQWIYRMGEDGAYHSIGKAP